MHTITSIFATNLNSTFIDIKKITTILSTVTYDYDDNDFCLQYTGMFRIAASPPNSACAVFNYLYRIHSNDVKNVLR